jgi:hypothetical protein
MVNFRNPRTPSQRLQDSVDMHDLSLEQLARLVRDVDHEINLRIDGLTPGADDVEHQDYHRRQQDREITEKRLAQLRKAQYWAGIRLGGTALIVLVVGLALMKQLMGS